MTFHSSYSLKPWPLWTSGTCYIKVWFEEDWCDDDNPTGGVRITIQKKKEFALAPYSSKECALLHDKEVALAKKEWAIKEPD